MKHLKMLGLAAVAAAALMAFVGASTASATVLTSPKGTVVKSGTPFTAKAEGTSTITTSFLNIECKESNIAGNTLGESGVSVSSLTFGSCNCEVKVLATGILSITVTGSGPNGYLSSSGATITTQCSTIFGTVHCIYGTNATELGPLRGSSATGRTATMSISGAGGAHLTPLSTNFICDEITSWDASYEVTQPDFLDVS